VVHQNFDQKEVQFVIVGLLFEPQAIYLLNEWKNLLALEGWTDILRSHAQLSFADFDELIRIRAHVVVSTLALSFHELEIAIDNVDEEICQRNQVISPAEQVPLESIFTTKNQIPLETIHLGLLVMVTIYITVSGAQPKINEFELVELSEFLWQMTCFTNKNVL
jgi:hypothetical protein